MKKLLALIFLIITFQISFAQQVKVTRKVISLYSKQSFYLNGGTRAAFGGKSRIYLPINLPANTIEWYYVFTTTPNENQNPSIGLESQLTRLIDPTGLTSIAVSSLLAPTGAGVSDVYIINDRSNLDNFINKTAFNYIVSGSRENFKDGVVQIKDAINGTYYLGFRNPSASTGINITVEVAAIVEETDVIQKTDNQQKADLYGSLAWKSFQNNDYDKCIELSKKALSLDSTLAWVQCNIALSYLVTGKNEASDAYIQAIDLIKKSPNPRKIITAAMQDINDIKLKVQSLKDADLYLGLLNDELKKH